MSLSRLAKAFFADIYIDALLFVIAVAYVFREPSSDLRYIVGLLLTVVALVLWIIARLQLGRSFSVKAKTVQLRTRGLYSRIRNPMYVFSTIAVAGIVIQLNHLLGYSFLLILVVLQIWRAKREEQALSKAFGANYEAYKARTWF